MLSRTVQMKGPKSIQYVTSAILEIYIYIYIYTHTHKERTPACAGFQHRKKIQDALKRGHPVLPELKIGKP